MVCIPISDMFSIRAKFKHNYFCNISFVDKRILYKIICQRGVYVLIGLSYIWCLVIIVIRQT